GNELRGGRHTLTRGCRRGDAGAERDPLAVRAGLRPLLRARQPGTRHRPGGLTHPPPLVAGTGLTCGNTHHRRGGAGPAVTSHQSISLVIAKVKPGPYLDS